ncbi:peptidoglycan-binding protein [Tenacibaculum sp. 190524A05c]|uniref:peptidoglycan-binding protein n=1 Tax=Tenacibaculum platacis TaxID=3137852 RepID=UPI0031FB904C
MKKDWYQKELMIKNTQKRHGDQNNRKDIRKIQSWLTLYSIQNPNSGTATDVDGDFGPATERAVKNFQREKGLFENGIVTQETFDVLCGNLKDAFEKPLTSMNFRDLVLETAENHLRNHPYELIINGESNSGPWVRAYMDGKDGAPWYWCMGFVQAIIDQAASAQGKNFKTLMPLTYSCDTVGTTGLNKNILTRYTKLRNDSSLIQAGDIFLIQKSPYDWTHTGIITSVSGDVIETIEGNTNLAGSRNGVAVLKRTRNLLKSKIDVFSIEPLV